MSESESTISPSDVRCAECGGLLAAGQDRVATDDRVFCRPCYDNLSIQLHQVIETQTRDVNYAGGLLGALLGGVIGVLIWWGFTVATSVAFGLVAVVIGVAVAKGAVLLSGNKRSQGLQILSVVVSAVAYFYASYLVNRTFILRAFAEEGQAAALPFVPGPGLFFEAIRAGFGLFDVVFLAIVLYQAWRIPAPLSLPPRA